jgi:hypothetical protein
VLRIQHSHTVLLVILFCDELYASLDIFVCDVVLLNDTFQESKDIRSQRIAELPEDLQSFGIVIQSLFIFDTP